MSFPYINQHPIEPLGQDFEDISKLVRSTLSRILVNQDALDGGEDHQSHLDDITIAQEFIGTKLRDFVGFVPVDLSVVSPEGSGKTQALKHVAELLGDNECILVVSHLRKLIMAQVEDLNRDGHGNELPDKIAYDYEHIKGAKSKLTLQGGKIIASTVHSAEDVLRILKESGVHVRFLVIDESESVADTISSKIMDSHYGKFLELVGELGNSAESIICMDANLGERTRLMQKAYFQHRRFVTLTNEFKRWKGLECVWYNGTDQGVELVKSLLLDGKKPAIACTSSSALHKVYVALEGDGLLDGLKVFRGYPIKEGLFERDSDEMKEFRRNPDIIYDYDVAFYSPSMGTGISISRNHFDTTVLFAVHDPECPDYTTASQMLFRVRHPLDNRVHVIAVDQSCRGRPLDFSSVASDMEAASRKKRRLLAENINDAAAAEILFAGFKGYQDYRMANAVITESRYEGYFSLLCEALEGKGLVITQGEVFEKTIDASESIKADKEASEAKSIKDTLAGRDIDDAEAADISQRMSRSLDVSREDLAAKRRYDLLVAYHDGSQVTDDLLIQYIGLDKAGIAEGRNNVAYGALSFDEVKTLEQYMINDGKGRGKFYVYGSDDIAIRAKWKLMRALDHVAGIQFDENLQFCQVADDVVVTKKSLADKEAGYSSQSAVFHLRDAINDWNSVHALEKDRKINLKKFNSDPVKGVRELIHRFLKLDTKAVYGAKGDFTVLQEQPVVSNFNMRRKKGLFGVLNLLAKAQAEQLLGNDGGLTEKVKIELGIDFETEQFFNERLKMVAPRNQAEVVSRYIKLLKFDRIPGDNLSPIYYANTYLREFTGG